MREYYQALKYLESLSSRPKFKKYEEHTGAPEFYLKRSQYLLDQVGNPERGMQIMHVAGTAGKGTVVNMLHNVLQAAGFKVGSFTSPYVTSAIEKIKVNDKYIPPGTLVGYVNQLKPHIEKAFEQGPWGGPSYFETFFAVAMLYFKEQKCDWVVLETGLGGAYDATNAIKKPRLTAISTIDYDHTEVLGKTLPKIARDKAGIIKTGSHFFTAEQRPALLKIFKTVCRQKGVPGHYIKGKSTRDRNVNLVKALAEHLRIKKYAVDYGISRTKLPARFEMMQTKPRIILDGAHNGVKIKSTIEQLRQQHYDRLILVLSIGHKKNPDEVLKQMVPLADIIIFTTFKDWYRQPHAMATLHRVAKKYQKKHTRVYSVGNPKQALAQAKKLVQGDDFILVIGSFYLAGQLRALWYPESYILEKRSSF